MCVCCDLGGVRDVTYGLLVLFTELSCGVCLLEVRNTLREAQDCL